MWNAFIDPKDKSPYADYTAYEKWMNSLEDSSNDFIPVWDSMDTLERIGLYSIMVNVLVRGKDVGWTEEEKIRHKEQDEEAERLASLADKYKGSNDER